MSGLIDALLGGIAGGAGFEAEQARERLKASREEAITMFRAQLLDGLDQEKETRAWERENDPQAFKNRIASADMSDRQARTGLLGEQMGLDKRRIDLAEQEYNDKKPSAAELSTKEVIEFAKMAKAGRIFTTKDKDGNWLTREVLPKEWADVEKARQTGDARYLRGDPARTQLFKGLQLFDALSDGGKEKTLRGTLEEMTQSLLKNNPGMTKQQASKRAQQLYMRGNPIMDMDAGTP